jgi:hypothetical protein
MLRRVFDFLRVDRSVPPVSMETNPSVAMRSQFLGDTVDRFSVGRGSFSRAVKSGIKAVVPESARRRVLQNLQSRIVYSPPPLLNDDLVTELRASLRPEVEHLDGYLDRDLVRLWGYDHV